MNYLKNILIGITATLAMSSVYASQAEEAFLTKIENIKTYQANFEQVIKDESGKVINKTKGIMLVKRPNRFYWESTRPDPMRVIADGKTLWSYDIELEQVTKQKLQAAIKNSPAAILAGEIDSFRKNFDVKHAKHSFCKPGKDCFDLTSNDEDPLFENIIMVMDEDKLLALFMTDQMGQQVVTNFSNIKVNIAINESKFVFNPPTDVDVVEMGNG